MKKLLLILCCILTSALCYAYDFEVDGKYYYIQSASDKTVILTYNQHNSGEYAGDFVIPETVSYNNLEFRVIGCDWDTFRGCYITAIHIPKGFTSFDYNYNWGYGSVFSNSLKSIYVPDLETWMNLKSNPTWNSYDLYVNDVLCENLYIPEGIVEIRHDAFGYCKSIKNVILSSTVKSIGTQAFYYCENLESIECNTGLESIEVNAFWEDVKLKTINIPCTVNLLGDGGNGYCFYNCSSLSCPITIPDGVTDIPTGFFSGCTSLEEVSISASVNRIYWDAFGNCSSLKNIYVYSSTPPLCYEANDGASTIFAGIDKFNCVIHVPRNAIEDYKKAEGWKQFFNIVPIEESNNFSFLVECSTGGKVHVLNNVVTNNSFATTITEGENITLSFTPDNGYELKSVVVNDVDVVTSVENNSYTISSVCQNTSVVVKYTELPVYLTIKSADYGCVSQVVDRGRTYTFVITPNADWSIESVSFNGENVTSKLDGNKYTTPGITSDSELNIVYKQNEWSAVKSVKNESNVKVSVSYGKLTLENSGTSTLLSVYTLSGSRMMLESVDIGTTTIDLPTNNIYIIKVGEETFKVSM